jgi:hypothetical protein
MQHNLMFVFKKLKLPVGVSPLQLVNLHRNRRYFVIKLHTWFCLLYFLKTNIKCYCIYQYFMSIGQQVYSLRLLSAISIFSAEYNVMLLALKFVASSSESQFVICSDSLSCPLAIESAFSKFKIKDRYLLCWGCEIIRQLT